MARCAFCHANFAPVRKKQAYCSEACRRAADNERRKERRAEEAERRSDERMAREIAYKRYVEDSIEVDRNRNRSQCDFCRYKGKGKDMICYMCREEGLVVCSPR